MKLVTHNIDNETFVTVAQAAANASAAANAAATAAATASTNAQIAAKAAADSSTAIAVVATDTSWMKKSLVGIEETLQKIKDDFPTRQEHNDLVKILSDHEVRINKLEVSTLRATILLTVGTSVLTLLTSLLIYHLFQN